MYNNTVAKWRLGLFPLVLTRGQTGLTVTHAALLLLLLLRDADVLGWARKVCLQ